jgi:hypothetical protein
MSSDFELVRDGESAVEIHRRGGGLLLRYIHHPDTPSDESPRPYAHPVCTLAGEVLTNFRPNDHRWHHGLSFTINSVSGHNFWGGGTYRRPDGYQWRNDHGTQRHVAWREQRGDHLSHTLEWRASGRGELLLQESRALAFTLVSPQAWSLRWTATLKNVSERTLEFGQYFSNEGLVGSHYTGLQFRGARDLLDDHGDQTIGIFADGGLNGEASVHGAAANWMEWRGQKDGSQRRVSLRFANSGGPLRWFVRRNNPLAALPFQFEQNLSLASGDSFTIDHRLTFADA